MPSIPFFAAARAGFCAVALAALVGVAPLAAVAQTAPAAPARPEPSAAALASAREVVIASGLARSIDPVVPQVIDEIRSTFATTRPELVKDLDAVLTSIRPEFEAQREEIINRMARSYTARLSESELRDLAAFFRSPLGAKYVQFQPQAVEELFNALQGWSQGIAESMLLRVRNDMKRRGHDL